MHFTSTVSCAAVLALLALPSFALSIPLKGRQDDSPCATGPLQCCQANYDVDSATGKTLLALHQQSFPEFDTSSSGSGGGGVGVGCNPVLGSTCTASPNCCEANAILLSLGCIVITL